IVIFQRSKGYEWRPSFSIEKLAQAIKIIKDNFPEIICMVDNCYGEFVENQEPLEVGADLIAGSLIKNPGGGLALTGGYLAGKENLINKAALRLTAPGIDLEVGSSLNFNRPAYQGLFMAPLIVGEALKGAVLAAKFFQLLGFPVLPQFDEQRTDIIQAIRLGSRKLMLSFCHGLQKACPLDAYVKPEPALLPGYTDEVIMAGGTFIQGSSIELSADGPIRPPYNIYLQGGLSLAHIKTGIMLAAEEMNKTKSV
ncbi:MAG: methionine gamma-lyase family protein, partial [Clostridia bacterium]|nr:methionine gamma-lyase family protein [Clostridia bacterium]